ncbi:MAG TPA: hypothetical protein VFG00_10295 [Acidothermaceae bacterium]|nr:hypothetical protein [Acidothermaceae bacterium]
MPNLPFWRRHSDQTDAEQLDQLLDAGQFDAAANPEWQSVSDVLRSAAAAAEPSELAGETATLAAFRRERVGIRHRRPQPIARYKTVIANRFSTLLPGRIAVGLAAGVVTLTGAATAAYACVLPAPIQSFAHTTIGAPRPPDPKLSVAAVDAANWKDHPASESVSATPTPSVSVSPASVTASVTPTPTPSQSPVPEIAKKPVLDPAQLAAVEALVDYRLCQSYTTLTKIGKTLDPKALAILAKAAGSTTPATITAYCAALPVPPNPCLAQSVPTASPSPSASPNTKNDKDIKGGDWWRWCGICPQATASPTATVSATATATPGVSSLHRFPFPWFWCGDRDPKASHSAKPTPSVKPTPTKTPFPGNWWGGGFGFGKDGNGQGSNGQGGNGAGTGGGQRDGTPMHAVQGANTGQHH